MVEHKVENKAEKHEKTNEKQQISDNAGENLRQEAYQGSSSQKPAAAEKPNTAAPHLPGLELTDSQKSPGAAKAAPEAGEAPTAEKHPGNPTGNAPKENHNGAAETDKASADQRAKNNDRAENQASIDHALPTANKPEKTDNQQQMTPQPGESAHNFVQRQLSDMQRSGAAPDLGNTAQNAAEIAKVVGSGVIEAGVHKAQELKSAVENGAKNAADWVHTHQGQTLGLIAVGAAAAIVEVGSGGIATPVVAGFVGSALAATAPAAPVLEAAGAGIAVYKAGKAISEASGHSDFGNLLRDNGSMSPSEKEKSQANLKNQTGENLIEAAELCAGAGAVKLGASKVATPLVEVANSAKTYVAQAIGINGEGAGVATAGAKVIDKVNSVAGSLIKEGGEIFTPVHKKPADDDQV